MTYAVGSWAVGPAGLAGEEALAVGCSQLRPVVVELGPGPRVGLLRAGAEVGLSPGVQPGLGPLAAVVAA